MSTAVVPTPPKTVSTDTTNIAYADFGCYITIVNNLRSNLVLISDRDPDGSWDAAPPGTILSNSTVQVHLRDPSGPRGSEGGFIYQLSEPNLPPATLESDFTCPFGSDNEFTASIKGNGSGVFKVTYPPVSGKGHPFSMTMTVSYS